MANDVTSVRKESKGRMVLIYATVDGEEQHFGSFFHEWKVDMILDMFEEAGVDVVRKKAPKKIVKKKR